MSIQLRITLSEIKPHGQGELPVHEYVRATTNATGEGIRRLLDDALGWMQQYAASVSTDQWGTDLLRVEEAAERAVAARRQAQANVASSAEP